MFFKKKIDEKIICLCRNWSVSDCMFQMPLTTYAVYFGYSKFRLFWDASCRLACWNKCKCAKSHFKNWKKNNKKNLLKSHFSSCRRGHTFHREHSKTSKGLLFSRRRVQVFSILRFVVAKLSWQWVCCLFASVFNYLNNVLAAEGCFKRKQSNFQTQFPIENAYSVRSIFFFLNFCAIFAQGLNYDTLNIFYFLRKWKKKLNRFSKFINWFPYLAVFCYFCSIIYGNVSMTLNAFFVFIEIFFMIHLITCNADEQQLRIETARRKNYMK